MKETTQDKVVYRMEYGYKLLECLRAIKAEGVTKPRGVIPYTTARTLPIFIWSGVNL